MSKQNSFDTAADQHSRRNRIHSVGLPSQTTLLPDPSLALNKNAPAVPRRHSAAPMVSAPPIPLRPPAIPKRNKNERPIPIVNPSRFEAKNQAAIQNPAQKLLADNSTYDGWDRLESSKPNPSCDPDYARRCFNNYALHFDRASIDPNLQVPSRTLHFNQRLQEYDSNIYDIDELKNVNSAKQSESDIRKQNEETGLKNCNGSKLEKTFQMKYENSSASDKNYDSKVENFFADKPSKFEEWQKKSQELENRLECGGNDKVQKLRHEIIGEKLKRIPKATQTNIPPPLNAICQNSTAKPTNIRQDSNISSDSYSQTSSPSYTNKTMEAPLLPQKYGHGKIYDCMTGRESKNPPTSPIIKSVSTPASLQAIVKFHNGSNMSLHNRIIKDIRRPSSHYVTKARFRFRFAQVLINAIALIIITGCFTAYIKTYPDQTAKMKNKTVYNEIINTLQSISSEAIIAEPKNPSPGVCLPVIVSFCQYHKIPYNFTVFPNYMGNFGQREAQNELHLYDSVVDVKCYELAALFLCSIFVPKCGSNGHVVPPCRSLCIQTMRRCGFFLEVFGLPLPDYLKCELFSENSNPDICVGQREVIEAAERASKPVCTNGFQCDDTRCIPLDWNCDGHIDCEDKTDETNCSECENDVHLMTLDRNKSRNETSISKLQLHCGDMKCLSPYIICDGVMDCPWGQDERYCLKLSDRNGDIASGRLEVYHAEKNTFIPACITRWDESTTAQNICSYLGYATVISSNFSMKNNNTSLVRTKPQSTLQSSRFSQKNIRGLLKSFQSCADQKNHRTLDLACSNYVCGRRRYSFRNAKVRTRIVGGVEVSPGDWPFLAALLGGPEEVFYCAGVLISDQWVLTASHCVGNYSNVSGWTIQLGITRRNSHTYLGEKLKVKRVVPHPNYDLEIVHDNDVALFQLANKVKFHEHLRPVCLPKANEEIEPQTVCTVIGWGKKNDTEFSEYEFAINEVEVPVLPRDVCNSWLEHKDLNVTDGMICAGYASGEKDACQGDSGGPLLCRDKHDREKWFVGGIVSWGIKCAYPKLPGVYAYVPKYIPWIQKEIAKYTEQS